MTLKHLLHPRTVAVVGASRNHQKLGRVVMDNILQGGFRGRVVPVHPSQTTIAGKKAYASVCNIPGRVDIAVIVTPPATVVQIVHECGKKHIPFAVIVTAGFGEIGEEGKKREQELMSVAARSHVTIVGPNCLGIINVHARFNAAFGGPLPQPGNVALVAQSGALSVALMDWARARRVGMSALISLGNKAGLTETACLNYLAEDRSTDVIALYLESILDGRAFMDAAARAVRTKPVLLIAAGSSGAGKRAAVSHTGALTSSRAVIEVACHASGVLLCNTLEDMQYAILSLSRNPVPHSDTVSILTNAGGPGVIATDAAAQTAVRIAPTPSEAADALRAVLPPAASVHNPIDLVGDALAMRYRDAFRVLTRKPTSSSVAVLLTPQMVTEVEKTAQAIVRFVHANPRTPVTAAFMGGERTTTGKALLDKAGVAVYETPAGAVQGLSVLVQYAQVRSAPRTASTIRPLTCHRALPSGTVSVLGTLYERPFRDAAIPLLPTRFVRSMADAARAVASGPHVLKIASHTLTHKTDVGGVLAGITTPAEARKAYTALRRLLPQKLADTEGVLIQPMVYSAHELLIGWRVDPSFGPVVTVGQGGIYAEQYRDVSQMIAPVSIATARDALSRLRISRILAGARKKRPVNMAALARLLVAVGRLALSYPEIVECDMNPVFVSAPASFHVADIRIVVRRS